MATRRTTTAPGQVTVNGQISGPSAPVPAAEYECRHCHRGRCASCTDVACTCCGGNPFGDHRRPWWTITP